MSIQTIFSFSMLIAALLFSIVPNTAHAYLDPGTGSMIVQVVIGGFLASLYTVKVYWQRIRAFFVKLKKST